jgi:hypothetical protein
MLLGKLLRVGDTRAEETTKRGNLPAAMRRFGARPATFAGAPD